MTDNETAEFDAPTNLFTAHLPIGETLPPPVDGIPFWDVCPYDGDVRIKVLEPPVLPEPPRHGEDPSACRCVTRPHEGVIWTDGAWTVTHSGEPTTIPMVMLNTAGHYDLADMPADLILQLGPMTQRIERAMLRLGGIGRVHTSRWGDGSAHFHQWFFGRPEGMMQLRGTCLPLWDDVLPNMPVDLWVGAMAAIGESLAADGGEAFPVQRA